MNTSIINIRFICYILLLLEVKYLLGYSSNIFFFFLFILVVYTFFNMNSIMDFKQIYFDNNEIVSSIYMLYKFKKILKSFIVMSSYDYAYLLKIISTYYMYLKNALESKILVINLILITLKHNKFKKLH